jgi:uncharacterized membrane protein YhaH (DUF805 family)
MEMAVFWIVVLCSLAMIVKMVEAGSLSETSVNFCHTTRRNNPDDSLLQDTYFFILLFVVLPTLSVAQR